MVDLVYYLTNLLSFDISLIRRFFIILISKLFCDEFFEIFVILSAILLPIKSPVTTAVFLITLFELGLYASLLEIV